MNKKELISRASDILKSNGIKKPIRMPNKVLHISDDDGNEKDFIIRITDKSVMYNANDISAILDSCLIAIEDALSNGEEINIHGFGTFNLHKRAARRTKHPVTGNPVEIDAHYITKFTPGKNLRMSAKAYEISLANYANSINDYPFEHEFDDEEDDD